MEEEHEAGSEGGQRCAPDKEVLVGSEGELHAAEAGRVRQDGGGDGGDLLVVVRLDVEHEVLVAHAQEAAEGQVHRPEEGDGDAAHYDCSPYPRRVLRPSSFPPS